MKVVIDTSVFLDAATNESSDAWKILNILERRQITPVFNQASWDELWYMTPRVVSDYMGYDFDWVGFADLPEPVRKEIDIWLWAFENIYCDHRIIVDREEAGDYVEDPDDQMIVAAALDGNAWFILHDDSDFDEMQPLVVVPEGHEVMCCRPGEFAAHFPDFIEILRVEIRKRLAS